MKALEKTGHVIAFAGIIMFIAFGALLFSSIEVLAQIGFMLAFSVLFDTFVICCCMVPPVMVFLRESAWWPSKLPVSHVERLLPITRIACFPSIQRHYERFIEWTNWDPEPTEPSTSTVEMQPMDSSSKDVEAEVAPE